VPVIHGMITYIQEPLEIGRRGSMGRRLNGNTLAAVNGHLLSVEGVSRVRERYGCGSASNGKKKKKI
jgi:hypothetical protein